MFSFNGDKDQRVKAAQSLKERIGNKLVAEGLLIKTASGEFVPNPNSEPLAPLAPVCKVCDGKGLISYEVPFGHPRFGKLFPCEHCETGRAAHQRQLAMGIARTGLPPAYQTLTFASFDKLHPSITEGKIIGRLAAEQWAMWGNCNVGSILERANVPHDGSADISRPNLVLYGDLGMGKTGLAAAAVDELRARGKEVLYIRMADLIAAIQSTYSNESTQTRSQIEDKFVKAPYLIIDEATGRWSADKESIAENIFRHRCAQLLPTLITTNHTSAEFAKVWGNRATSVLLETAHWVELIGTPVRQTNQSDFKG